MDGGVYLSEARSWSDSPGSTGDRITRQTMVAVFAPKGGGEEITSYKGIDLRRAH